MTRYFLSACNNRDQNGKVSLCRIAAARNFVKSHWGQAFPCTCVEMPKLQKETPPITQLPLASQTRKSVWCLSNREKCMDLSLMNWHKADQEHLQLLGNACCVEMPNLQKKTSPITQLPLASQTRKSIWCPSDREKWMELKTSNECFFWNQHKTDVLSFRVLISGVQYLLIVLLLYALFGKNHSRTCILAGSSVITKLDGCSAFQGGSVKPISVLPLSRESLKGDQCQSAIQYWSLATGHTYKLVEAFFCHWSSMGCLVIMNALFCIVHPSNSCMFRLLINNCPISNSCKGTSRVAGVHLVDFKKGKNSAAAFNALMFVTCKKVECKRTGFENHKNMDLHIALYIQLNTTKA